MNICILHTSDWYSIKKVYPFLEAAKTLGYKSLVVSDDTSKTKNLATDHLEINLGDIDTIFRFLKKYKITHIVGTSSRIMPIVGALNNLLEIKGTSKESYEILSNKEKLSNFCEEHGITVPRTFNIKSKQDLENFRIDKPIIIKPVYGSGSFSEYNFAYKKFSNSNEFKNFLNNYDSLELFLKAQNKDYFLDNRGNFIVQEMINTGVCYNYGFIKNNRNLICYLNNRSLKKEQEVHRAISYLGPVNVEKEIEDKIFNSILKIVNLLKLDQIIFNVEFIIDSNNNPNIIDFNPRLSDKWSDVYKKLDPKFFIDFFTQENSETSLFVKNYDLKFILKSLDINFCGEIKRIFLPNNTDLVELYYRDHLKVGSIIPNDKNLNKWKPYLIGYGKTFEEIDQNFKIFKEKILIC